MMIFDRSMLLLQYSDSPNSRPLFLVASEKSTDRLFLLVSFLGKQHENHLLKGVPPTEEGRSTPEGYIASELLVDVCPSKAMLLVPIGLLAVDMALPL